MLLILFRSDYRDILTSDTSPDKATGAAPLSSSSLENSTFTTETWFISKDNLEIEARMQIVNN